MIEKELDMINQILSTDKTKSFINIKYQEEEIDQENHILISNPNYMAVVMRINVITKVNAIPKI